MSPSSNTSFSPMIWRVIDHKHVLNLNHTNNINILVTLCLAFLLAAASCFRRRRKAPVLPPGPRGVPLLGYLPFLGRDLHRQFADLALLYGPIFKFWLGGKLCFVITSPALVRELAREKDALFANHEVSVAGAISTHGGRDIAFSPLGPRWRKLRRIFAQEAMSKAALDGLGSLRREAVRKSLGVIFEGAGEAVDVGHVAFVTSVDSMLKMLWGGSMDGMAAAEAEELRTAVWEILFLVGKPNVSDVFPALAWLDVQGVARETQRLTAIFERMFDSVIEERRRTATRGGDRDGCNKATRKDFLQFMLEFQDDEKGEDSETSITLAQLKATLMDPVVGGTESTSVTVEWAMAELLLNPAALTKVNEELARVVGLTMHVEESHLSQLPYLNAVVKETLRLHPALPLLVPRFPSRPTTLGGYTVPQGTTVFINAWAIHRNPSAWEEPLKFKPERFLGTEAKKFDFTGNDFNYTPFGSGRRICAGLALVERTVPYFLASFLHAFEWKLSPEGGGGIDLSDQFGLVMKMREPLVAIPTPRLLDLSLYSPTSH